MGSLIGVLSTVILVSTVCTLIFAVGAYVISRKNRDGVGVMEAEDASDTDIADQFPTASPPAPQANIFKRVHPESPSAPAGSEPEPSGDVYQWK